MVLLIASLGMLSTGRSQKNVAKEPNFLVHLVDQRADLVLALLVSDFPHHRLGSSQTDIQDRRKELACCLVNV